jgi:hypothetical protein
MEHTELLNELTLKADEMGLTMFEHSYNHLAFGSWFVIFGKPHHRLHFSWDGKDSYLNISESDFGNSNSLPNWKPISTNNSVSTTEQENIFEFIINKLGEQYGT